MSWSCDRFDGNIWRPKESETWAVPLPDWVMRELRGLLRRTRLVFAPSGRAFHPDSVSQAFDKVLKKVAADLTLHDLRHTFITDAMERGIPAARVQQLAGHKLLSNKHVGKENRQTET